MNRAQIKFMVVRAAEKFIPPLIRNTLLEESDFRNEYGLKGDVVLKFNVSGFTVSIQRSYLFETVRTILADGTSLQIIDMDGQEWDLKNISTSEELPRLALSRDKQQLILPDLAVLSPSSFIRLRALDENTLDVNLPSDIQNVWRDILVKRALEDDEVDDFLTEFSDTPVQMAQSIHREAQRGIKVTSLVPNSRKYFERLVGKYDGSGSIKEYAAKGGRIFLEQLSNWQPYEGFLFSLLLSSHSSMTSEINVDRLDTEDLVHAFNFLEKHGDRISQIGAIEIGLRILPLKPDLEPILMRLIKQIHDDVVEGQASGFKLLSALFILVDGELSRTRLLFTEPPFYRRLAALSQAALVYRQVMNLITDVNNFYKWVSDNVGEQFYMQSFADMRLEPRWHPDFAAAQQMKADFYGRIILAAKTYENNIKNSELSSFIFSDKSENAYSPDNPLQLFLPGPLEGTDDMVGSTLPTNITKLIQTQLSSNEIEPLSFIVLVNSALIFRIGTEQAELAARALKVGNYRLTRVKNKDQLMAVLDGLAAVAAVTRNRVLGSELRILVRRYRHDLQYTLSVENALRICFVAGASNSDLDEWRDFLGDWLTELAFSTLGGDDGKIFLSRLRCLFRAAPELWVSCGRAEAALIAYNGSRH